MRLYYSLNTQALYTIDDRGVVRSPALRSPLGVVLGSRRKGYQAARRDPMGGLSASVEFRRLDDVLEWFVNGRVWHTPYRGKVPPRPGSLADRLRLRTIGKGRGALQYTTFPQVFPQLYGRAPLPATFPQVGELWIVRGAFDWGRSGDAMVIREVRIKTGGAVGILFSRPGAAGAFPRNQTELALDAFLRCFRLPTSEEGLSLPA